MIHSGWVVVLGRTRGWANARRGLSITDLEAKSGATAPSDALAAITKLATTLRNKTSREQVDARLVYGGDTPQQRTDASVIPCSAVPTGDWDA